MGSWFSKAKPAVSITLDNNTAISCEKPDDVLAIPGAYEGYEKWSSPVRKVKALLENNRSLAFSTDEAFVSTHKTLNVAKIAYEHMSGKEKAAYDDWQAGTYDVKEWNVTDEMVAGVDATKLKSELWTVKVAAIERIYKEQAPLTPAHAKAWVRANPRDLVLYTAVVHVVKSERSACGGKIGKRPGNFIEAVACRKFLYYFNRHAYSFAKARPDAIEINHLYGEVKELVEARLEGVTRGEN